MDDTKRIDWLANTDGYALISDDNGHWACVCDGFQNCPMDDEICDIQSVFWIEKQHWKNSIREAIDFAIHEDDNDTTKSN